MKNLIHFLLEMFVLGLAVTSIPSWSGSRFDSVNFISSTESSITVSTPAEGIKIELDAAEAALAKGDYDNAISHADNIRFIVANTKESIPNELPAIETIARHMQVAGMVDEADDLYRRGAYNRAVERFNQAIYVMTIFKIRPSQKAFLLAKKIDSGLLQPIYIPEGIPLPVRISM